MFFQLCVGLVVAKAVTYYFDWKKKREEDEREANLIRELRNVDRILKAREDYLEHLPQKPLDTLVRGL